MSKDPDLSKPWCYYVSPSQDPEKYGGYIPSLVVKGQSGHWPMIGSGKWVSPWVWGKTLEEAQETCKQVNAKRGVTEEAAAEIVSSSMLANAKEES